MAPRDKENGEYIVEIILAAFATYRLASLLVEEDGPFRAFAILRERIMGKALATKRKPWLCLSGLVMCQLCAGVWMAAFCAGLVIMGGKAADAFLLIFGLAGMQALLSRLG